MVRVSSSFSAVLAAVVAFVDTANAKHILDGLTAEEYTAVRDILLAAGQISDESRFSSISFIDPDKSVVLEWSVGDDIPERKASAIVKEGANTYKGVVDLLTSEVVSWEESGQGMLLIEEFLGATDLALAAPEMVAGLALRNLTVDDVYCAPLTVGYFGEAQARRLMKAPCFLLPDGTSNRYAYPVEGLFATIDLGSKEVLEVSDMGVVPVPSDPWGFTPSEVRERFGALRPDMTEEELDNVQYPKTTPDEADLPYMIDMENSLVEWDIWRFHFRSDKRPGLILSQIEANDQGTWRSVLYQAHLSEVFVPYMTPDLGWYFRTYMDSGEYGFGIFMSPMTPGVDCPSSASFFGVIMHDDEGTPFEVPDSVCAFERSTGDPAWRHYEFTGGEDQKPAEGRPWKEFVFRHAAQVGNYDYLIDYIFMQDGTIRVAVGSTGLDAVAGVASTSTESPTYEQDTKYGTLLAENLVAIHHSHFFNFRLDFDIDGQDNDYVKAKLVPTPIDPSAGIDRTSMWTVQKETPGYEIPARTVINSMEPSNLLFVNQNEKVGLGHNPGYQLVPGGSYVSDLMSADDYPVMRNPYIQHQLMVSAYDPTQVYAGGEFAVASTGDDTLKTWTDANRTISNTDIVAWYTVGFHHVPRTEDWPVMPTNWKVFELRPFNFFPTNPSIQVAPSSMGVTPTSSVSAVRFSIITVLTLPIVALLM